MYHTRKDRHCIECGDVIGSHDNEPFEVQDMMTMYCRDCARESLGLAFSIYPTTFNRDTGGGRRVIRETKTH